MNYQFKENKMKEHLAGYESPAGFRSTYKAVPYQFYGLLKPYIDFTKYYVMFRGPRPSRAQSSTRKRDAKAFDVYMRSARDTMLIRTEREAFQRGVQWANNRSN
jgi:hypothetical protein